MGKSSEGDNNGLSAYQAYVKSNSARIRSENPGIGLGEVMKRLGEEFRQMKAQKSEQGARDEEASEDVTVVEKGNLIGSDQDDDVDDVVKKLDILYLVR